MAKIDKILDVVKRLKFDWFYIVDFSQNSSSDWDIGVLIVDLALSFDDSDDVSLLQLESLWDGTLDDIEVDDSGSVSEDSSDSLLVLVLNSSDLGLNGDEVVWVWGQVADFLQVYILVIMGFFLLIN